MGIYNSLPIVARALSSQIGLNVSVGGNEAYATETGAGFLITFHSSRTLKCWQIRY